MSAPKHSTKISIYGEEYTIKSDATPEHTRAVADHVDQAIRGVMASGAVVDANRAAILAALSITDALFKERSGNVEMAQQMEALASELRRWLPPAKRGA